MILDELNTKLDSKNLNEQARRTFGFALNLKDMTIGKANKLQNKLSTQMKLYENTDGSKVYDNKKYTQMKLALETIDSWINEQPIDEEDVEEANAFNTARDKAIADGKSSFTFNGKTYPITDKGKDDEDRAKKRFGESNILMGEGVLGLSKNSKYVSAVAEMMDDMGVNYKKSGTKGIMIMIPEVDDQKKVFAKIRKELGMPNYYVFDMKLPKKEDSVKEVLSSKGRANLSKMISDFERMAEDMNLSQESLDAVAMGLDQIMSDVQEIEGISEGVQTENTETDLHYVDFDKFNESDLNVMSDIISEYVNSNLPQNTNYTYDLMIDVDRNEDVVESKQINEGEMEKSELVLAAKSMVDNYDAMLKTIGEMANEELQPLVDKIRDEMGSDVAEKFMNQMNSTLTTTMDNIKTDRTSIDNATRILVGEEPVADTMGTDIEDLPAMEPTVDQDEEGDDFGASDAAMGGDEPLGREKRD
tara:strand:- start:131 stop:1552 length:1422 start_codon:yes stop_codon:yes gene_type:complete